MLKPALEDIVNDLNAITLKTQAVIRLTADVFNLYYLVYESLPDRERGAWDELLARRLTWMTFRENPKETRPVLNKVTAAKEPSLGVRQVHFGQLRAAVRYQSAYTIHSAQNVAGKTVMEVAQEIATGAIGRDELTVKIFYNTGVWVTVNNRSLAAYSLAAAEPMRLIPCLPTQDELNRLAEREDLPVAPIHERLRSDRERFADEGIELPPGAETMLAATSLPNGRTLPSPLLPLTPGPEDRRVLGVVRSIME